MKCLSVLMAGLVVLGLGGCLGDAPRDNPLDPNSDDFRNAGAVAGRVTRFYPPYAAVPGAQVYMTPGGYTTRADAQGAFTFADVPVGRYQVVAEQEGFAAAADSVEVVLGRRVEGPALRLDGLPVVAELGLHTVHISRWWPPPSDLYQLEVVADVEDPDGLADVDRVWLEVPELGFVDTLRATQVAGRYALNVTAAALGLSSLHALLGHGLVVKVRDQAGTMQARPPQPLVRVIDETPVAAEPQGLNVVDDATPLLVWEPAAVPFPFTYRVDVVRDETNFQSVVHTVTGLAPDASAYEVRTPLAPGTYYWTLSVVDAFGNRSRSKEAGFIIQ